MGPSFVASLCMPLLVAVLRHTGVVDVMESSLPTQLEIGQSVCKGRRQLAMEIVSSEWHR